MAERPWVMFENLLTSFFKRMIKSMEKPLNQCSASEACNLLKSGQISAAALVDACLERISARDEEVLAWEFVSADAARAQAASIDEAVEAHGLCGVPVGIKDIIDTSDMPTTQGSAIFQCHYPATNSDCVERLIASGAVIMGKTVTTEFAYLNPGKTRNPHDLQHTPGGSSSGSAAAVADFQVPLALGTQTAGSIIRPASYCGVVGFKPTFGTFDRAGIHPFAPSLDTLGGFARCVEDIGLLCNALGDREMKVSSDPLHRVAFCEGPEAAMAEPASREMLASMQQFLGSLGVQCDSLELDAPFDSLTEAQRKIQIHECVDSLRTYYEEDPGKLSEKLRLDYEAGLALDSVTMQEAYEVVKSCRDMMSQVFEKYDVIMTFASTGRAPAGLQATGDPVFNRMWTAIGSPCISVPVPQLDGELPLGLQIVGALGEDARLLNHSCWFEEQLLNYRPSR